MKIATWNVNNVRKRADQVLDWAKAAAPDVICLQELKTADADLPRAAFEAAGWHGVWVGQKTWNGVAILSRSAPVTVRTALPGDDADRQARYVEAAVAGVLIACLYAPNGNPCPGPKFDTKLAWLDRLTRHAAGLIAAGVPAVLAGDFNVVPEPRDIYDTTSYDGDALVSDEARMRFAALLAQGWTDALRQAIPDGPAYTFWDYRRRRWARDAGLRIDHLLLSPAAALRFRDAGVDRIPRGWDAPSDHAPVWALIAD